MPVSCNPSFIGDVFWGRDSNPEHFDQGRRHEIHADRDGKIDAAGPIGTLVRLMQFNLDTAVEGG